MAEDISNPLLSLVKEQGLVDDLQYEEVLGEFKRSGKPVIQILQDFGIMDLDDVLEVIANHLSTEVVKIREAELTPK
jgi:predicted hydrolase (HD superfamily)